jgi:NADH:ubiquinone oxidoreductase subunit 4 (subunit M)
VIQNVLLGPFNEKWAGLGDLHRYEVIALVPLVILMFLIGIYPSIILNTINAASVAILKIIAG